MSLFTEIYNWGAAQIKSFYLGPTVGLTACTPQPAYEATPATVKASDPITLERPEIDAIMNMNAGRGNACSMHEMYQGPNTDFWNDAALYIIGSKFSPSVRNESAHGITQALVQLEPNQINDPKGGVIALLAAELIKIGDPVACLGERDYALGCARNLFALTEPFPTMKLNVSYNGLLQIIDAAKTNIAAESLTCPESKPDVDLAHFFAISEVSPPTGAQGSEVELTIVGTGINFFGEDNSLPKGLEIDLGSGITMGKIKRNEAGALQVILKIADNAELSVRDVIIKIADQGYHANIGCFAFEVVRGTGRKVVIRPAPESAPAPAPAPRPTSRPAPAPAPKPEPAPAPKGNPFEL